MLYRPLGRTGVKVSQICLGTMMFGGPCPAAESVEIMHRAIDDGINFFDTANIYVQGQSEVVIGQALSDRRDRVFLATKGRSAMGTGPNDAGGSRLHLMRSLDESLKRLKTDYVDLYYIHAPDAQTPIEETLRAMDDMVRSGRVRYLACSNFRAWRVVEALAASDRLLLNKFVCVQPLYNIVNRDIEVELLPMCQAMGLGVVSYSPLARGVLTGKYRAGEPFPEGSRAARNDKRMKEAELRDASFQAAEELRKHAESKGVALSHFALAWCLRNPILTSIIVGPRTMGQYTDNMLSQKVILDASDEEAVNAIIPPGEHSGKGFQDPAYPVTGRGL